MENCILSIDMHTHLLEKKVKPKKYWERAKKIGLNAVAICEHSEMNPKKAYDVLKKEMIPETQLIPGMEVKTEKGHILAYSEDENIYSIKELGQKEINFEELFDVAKENNLILSIAHPWGFDYDSLGFYFDQEEIEELVKREFVGVEAYNGMIGYLGNFIYDSSWIKKPINFFDFLEKNKILSKIGMTKITGKITKTIDKQRLEVLKRNIKAIELSKLSKFVTAGSDAHTADRLGTGIMKVKFYESEITPKNILESILKKENVIWAGPLVREVDNGMYEKVYEPIKRKEILEGITYITKSIIKKQIGKLKKIEKST
ncbi:MAG: hypothetical protein N3D73_00690 [Candidatus Diapherotrites archaeon]|nr:hypothetical protein [Candidatus Diapherotrites archaeon]